MAGLPKDLVLKILDLLETKDRARLALLSKEWHSIVTSTWKSIVLEPKDAGQVSSQMTWLEGLTRPLALRSLDIHPAASEPDLLLQVVGMESPSQFEQSTVHTKYILHLS